MRKPVPIRKPIIGIAPDFNPRADHEGRAGEATVFLRNRYLAAIEATGGLPVILPVASDPSLGAALLDHLDGLMLTGSGPDINPRRYGERQRFPFTVMSKHRTDSECALLLEAHKRDLPVLGICGGMQLMNVALGGTLVQDISEQVDGALAHRMSGPATTTCHPVTLERRSHLYTLLRRDSVPVNSSHHQAVKAIAHDLAVSAVAPDGVIEAIEDRSRRFFIGVQWHPEYLYRSHRAHRALFTAFVDTARATCQS